MMDNAIPGNGCWLNCRTPHR